MWGAYTVTTNEPEGCDTNAGSRCRVGRGLEGTGSMDGLANLPPVLGAVFGGILGASLAWLLSAITSYVNAQKRRKAVSLVMCSHIGAALGALDRALAQIEKDPERKSIYLGHLFYFALLPDYRLTLAEILTGQEMCDLETAFRQSMHEDEIMRAALEAELAGKSTERFVQMHKRWMAGSGPKHWKPSLESIHRKLHGRAMMPWWRQ